MPRRGTTPSRLRSPAREGSVIGPGADGGGPGRCRLLGRRNRAAGQGQQRRPHVEQLGGMALGNQLAGVVLLDLVEVSVAQELDELIQAGQERRLAAAP